MLTDQSPLKQPLQVRIACLDGLKDFDHLADSDIFIEVGVWLYGVPQGLPARSRNFWGQSATGEFLGRRLNELLEFVVCWDDLTPDASLEICAFAVTAESPWQKLIGRSKFSLVSAKDHSLLTGWHRASLQGAAQTASAAEAEDMSKEDIATVPWLDRLVQKTKAGEVAERPGLVLHFEVVSQSAHHDGSTVRVTDNGCDLDGEVSRLTSAWPAQQSELFGINSLSDPEYELPNPIEHKARQMAKRGGEMAAPNTHQRDKLDLLVHSLPTQVPTDRDIEHLWRFRHYLVREKQALVKFLRSVDWKDVKDVEEAVKLATTKWAKPDIGDTLQLLSENVPNVRIREYAVKCLEQATDEELLDCLLQLVQALRYEQQHNSALSRFLLRRASQNGEFATRFHWFLVVEEGRPGQEDKSVERYNHVMEAFQSGMMRKRGGAAILESVDCGEQLVNTLRHISTQLVASGASRANKADMCQQMLAESDFATNAVQFASPVNPEVMVTHVEVASASVLGSANAPLKIQLARADGASPVTVLYKMGDDLRQDQLVLQVIALMDKLLKRENVDLDLVTYSVLATGSSEGLVEFVEDSVTLHDIMKEYGNVIEFLRAHNYDSTSPSGIKPEVLDTYVKSTAGYLSLIHI
eukprot:TRINITY_DN1400_c0_g1_i4.p1 TRINITY_DN1400_c0_g1~~TRINITY_DN1400_c0_g1_i4.p1  ORF type:complete len:638 (-),score=168.10 TRINITY_DN1400_c0_g1_i4:124-2037(-)